MKSLFINSALIFSVLFFACKSKQATANTTDNTNTSTNSADVNAPKTYRLIVSFISIGTGVDGDAYSKLEKFVQGHPKKPAYEKKRWGREGEEDFMFTLKEFKAADQAKFISDLKAAVGKSDRVLFKENEKSR